MTIVSLLTDFGLKDGYVAAMKAVMLSIDPTLTLVDISHDIQPQNVAEGHLILKRTAVLFPPGTVHLCVIDPGVGTARRPIAVFDGTHTYVGPDNGVFSHIIRSAPQAKLRITHLTNPEYWRSPVSNTFHGRDIFAPVAAHLALNTPLSQFGPIISDPLLLTESVPEVKKDQIIGQVIHIDKFGNLTTNIPAHLLSKIGISFDMLVVAVNNQSIAGISSTFAAQPNQSIIAYIGSSNDLMIGKVNGNAAVSLSVTIGNPVKVTIQA